MRKGVMSSQKAGHHSFFIVNIEGHVSESQSPEPVSNRERYSSNSFSAACLFYG